MKLHNFADRGVESGDVAVADEWLRVFWDHIKVQQGSRRMAQKPPRRQKIPAISLREKSFVEVGGAERLFRACSRGAPDSWA